VGVGSGPSTAGQSRAGLLYESRDARTSRFPSSDEFGGSGAAAISP